MHLFADVSSRAYGVVTYIRIHLRMENGRQCCCVHVPIKVVTIPRLELCAMVLGCSLIERIKEIPLLKEVPVFVDGFENCLYCLRKPVNQFLWQIV